MSMVQRALRTGTEDAEFSEYLPGLKSALLRTPPQVPESAAESGNGTAGVLPPSPS